MPAYGVTAAGFVTPPLSVILSGMQQQIWNSQGSQLDLSAQTPDGQILGIFAAQYAAQWELLQVCFNQYNREDAEGAALDNIGDLTGTPREGASYTQVYCVLGLDPADAPYDAGSLVANVEDQVAFTFSNFSTITAAQISPNVAIEDVTDDGGLIEIETAAGTQLATGDTVTIVNVVGTVEANATWQVTVIDGTHFTLQSSTFTNAYVSGGTVISANITSPATPTTATALMQSTVIGETAAVNDNTLNEITTPVTGWSSVNNPGPGSQSQAGENEETDYAYGPRQEEELAASGSCNPSATAEALIEFAANLEPPVSINVQVLENPEWFYQIVQEIGIPPHSYVVVVYDSTGTLTSAQIGQVIYDNKPAGLVPTGQISVTVVDPILGDQVVYYNVPTARPLYVSATVTPRQNVNWTALQAAIRAALVEAAVAATPASGEPAPGQLVPGGTVYLSQLMAVIQAVPGVQDVSVLTFGFSSSPGGSAPLAIAAKQIATISSTTVGTNVVLTQGTV